MTLKEKLMNDSWDYDFPMSNRQAESIVNLIDRTAIRYSRFTSEYTFHKDKKLWVKNNSLFVKNYNCDELLELFKEKFII